MTIEDMDRLLGKLQKAMPQAYDRLVEASRDGAEFAMFGGAMPLSKAVIASAFASCQLQFIVEVHAVTQRAKRRLANEGEAA